MSVPGNLYTPTIRKTRGADYLIEQSLLFNDGDSAYLTRTPSVAGNRKTWTFSCWVKRGSVGVSEAGIFASASSSFATALRFDSADNLNFRLGDGSGDSGFKNSNAVFRDTSAWYHIVVSVDTTNSTAADRIRLWVNGARLTDFSASDDWDLNKDSDINDGSTAIRLGYYQQGSGYFDGLMALPILVDGAALDPTSFGELDDDGYWNPIEYTGSYGTNGGAYDFADSSWFGLNVAGNDDQTALSAATPSATAWLNITGAWTMGSGTASRTSTVNAIRSASVFTGDFSLALNMASGATAARVGVYAANEDGTFVSSGADSAGLNSMTNSFYANFGAGNFFKGASSTVGVSQTNGAITITRVSGVITINTAGGNHEFSATYTGPMRLAISGGGATMSFTGIAYTADGQAGNSFFDTGFATTDQVADTPTDDADLEIGNHVRFTPLGRFTDITLSEGNSVMTNANASTRNCELSIAPESGKFIFEINPSTAANIGMAFARNTYDRASNANWGNSLDAIRMFRESNTNLRTYYNTGSGVNVNIGVTIDNTNDRIVYAIDADNRYLWLGLWDASASAYIWLDGSGGVTGAPATGTNPTYTLPGTGEIYIAGETVSGQPITLYSETAKMLGSGVSGFKALATQNLPAPTIADPSAYFNTVLYTGDGAARSITGIGFQPDFVWLKSRDSGAYAHFLFDSVRGAENYLFSNVTNAEGTGADTLTSFDADGFSLGSNIGLNTNTDAHVAWCWKAGGAASSNTDGSITSSVSANPTSGFSIVSYTGTGANATVGHGLSSAPKLVMVKNRDQADAWEVYHEAVGATYTIRLNSNAAAVATSTRWNDTAPTSSVISVGTDGGVNASAEDYIAYCWAEVDGFSKFGSYEGNANADGTFIYTGFKPAMVLIKNIDSASGSWEMHDNKRSIGNPSTLFVQADSTAAEASRTNGFDMLANGFKHREAAVASLNNANSYLYAVFAESPFQGDAGVTQARAR